MSDRLRIMHRQGNLCVSLFTWGGVRPSFQVNISVGRYMAQRVYTDPDVARNVVERVIAAYTRMEARNGK